MKNQKGFSLIELLIVVAIIGIIAAIAIPNLLAARRASNEAAALSTMKTIGSAEATYFSTKGQGNTYAKGSDLASNKLLDDIIGQDVVGTQIKAGYSYGIALGQAGNTQFDAFARPESSASRGFYTNEAGVIYYKDGIYPLRDDGSPAVK